MKGHHIVIFATNTAIRRSVRVCRPAGGIACHAVLHGNKQHEKCGTNAAFLGNKNQSRSSSLMEVLARVRASTRLTMTAQYRLYLPSADGRLPLTTTLPAGMRP